MTTRNVPDFTFGREEAAFLGIEHLSIVAASSGPDNTPCVARALGRRLSPDLRRVTLFFSFGEAGELLSHVTGNRKIAAVFSLPSTHESLQLKGSDAAVGRPTKGDLQLVESYRKAFVSHLEKLGYPAPAIQAVLACEADEIAAVTFTPAAAFSQTPGPNAGRAIGTIK